MGRTVLVAAPATGYLDSSEEPVTGVKPKRYPHLDWPLSSETASKFSLSSDQVLEHKFFPLLRYETSERRVITTMNEHLELKVLFEEKTRPISYASHSDAAIFSLFNKRISIDYEEWLADKEINASVLAYRPGAGTNIEASKHAFDEIRAHGKCVAIAADISGFFDHIPHSYLKAGLHEITGADLLPADLYKIYRAITNYSFIEMSKIEQRLGIDRLPSPICSYDDFRAKLKPLIEKSCTDRKGIPQGSSLSGLFANIAMIEFDLYMSEACKALNASYRRYSDDICIIAPTAISAKAAYRALQVQAGRYGLVVKDTKTQVSVFNSRSSRKVWSFRQLTDPATDEYRVRASSAPFQYLGFTFDGDRTLIRSSSIQRYYKKMRKNLFRYVGISKKKGIAFEDLHLRGQYRRWTHQNKTRGSGVSGNFITYAFRAARIHESVEMRRQVKGHIRKFKSTLNEAAAKYYA